MVFVAVNHVPQDRRATAGIDSALFLRRKEWTRRVPPVTEFFLECGPPGS